MRPMEGLQMFVAIAGFWLAALMAIGCGEEPAPAAGDAGVTCVVPNEPVAYNWIDGGNCPQGEVAK